MRFKLNHPSVPRDYRPVFVSFIKGALKNVGAIDYYYYENNQKSFTFSIKLPGPVFTDDCVQLNDNNFTLSVTTYNQFDGINLYNAFLTMRNEEYPVTAENKMKLYDVKLVSFKTITENKIKIKMLSPLVVRDHAKGTADKYYIAGEENFTESIKICIDNQLKSDNLYLINDLLITPVISRKTVVTSFGVKIRCTIGVFELTGNSKLLDYLYQSGMGSKRNQGFGMFELV